MKQSRNVHLHNVGKLRLSPGVIKLRQKQETERNFRHSWNKPPRPLSVWVFSSSVDIYGPFTSDITTRLLFLNGAVSHWKHHNHLGLKRLNKGLENVWLWIVQLVQLQLHNLRFFFLFMLSQMRPEEVWEDINFLFCLLEKLQNKASGCSSDGCENTERMKLCSK